MTEYDRWLSSRFYDNTMPPWYCCELVGYDTALHFYCCGPAFRFTVAVCHDLLEAYGVWLTIIYQGYAEKRAESKYYLYRKKKK